MPAKVNLTISDQIIFDLLDTAFCGDVHYWLTFGKSAQKLIDNEQPGSPLANKVFALLKTGKELPILDSEDSKPIGKLTLNGLEGAAQIMAEQQPHHFADLMTERYDMETADIFLQCAVMGEVRYS